MSDRESQTGQEAPPDLKVGEFATKVNATPATITRLLRDGTIRGYQLGGHWRIPAAELDRIRNTPGAEDAE